jgi:6-phosphogluconolactonase
VTGAPSAREEHVFDTPDALATALAVDIAHALAAAVAARGRASLIVSGGTTPRATFTALAQASIDWSRVTISLSDERWVPPQDPASNEAMVRATLLQGTAAPAHFVGLYTDDPTPEAGAPACAVRLAALARPFDYVLLGMGTDGHTASLFPGAEQLASALDAQAASLCVAIRAPGAAQSRMSLTLRALLDARMVALLFHGPEKRAVYERALGAGAIAQMPVRAVLRQTRAPVHLWWSRSD